MPVGTQEKELIAHVRELEVVGFRERHIQRPVHSFVTIAVDGDQQVETPHRIDTLNPKWEFETPFKMMVRASSTIKFTVYREHIILSKVGNNNHCCGELEMELQDVLTNPCAYYHIQCPWYSREENLQIRVHIELESTFRRDTLLDHAQEQLGRSDSNQRDLKKKSSAMSLIGFAVENLDQVVSIVDGLVEIHPMCKVAWMVLGSVYKAFKDQHALDQQSRELAQELKETLAYAKECRDLEAIPEATDVLLEIAKLVVQSAAAFDAHMKYSVTTRALMSAATKASQNRILDCDQRLKVLRKKLQETLTIRIFQGQNALLAHNGLRDNGSSRSLPKERSLQPKYVPLPGKHRAGYSPVYLSRPIDEPSEQIRQSPPASHLFLPPDDGLRRFTSSPEPMDSHMFMPPPSLRTFGQSSMPDPYSPIEPTWSPWPMSSRTVSFTTDSGRTLSSKSSCSSLSEPCDCPHSEPEIYDPDAENLEETIVGGRSTPASDIQAPNTIPQSRAPRNVDFGISPQKHQAHALPTALPLAMPIPMSWSQRSL